MYASLDCAFPECVSNVVCGPEVILKAGTVDWALTVVLVASLVRQPQVSSSSYFG